MVFVLLGPVGFYAPVFLWIIPLIEIATRWRAIAEDVRENGVSLLWKNGFLFTLPLYGLLSVIWSINPQDSAATALKVFAFITVGAVLIGAAKRTATGSIQNSGLTWVAYGFIATELVVLTDLALDGVIYKSLGHIRYTDIVYGRGSVVAALTLLPISIALACRANWMLLAPFLVLGLATIFLLSSMAAMFVVFASAIVYALVRWKKRLFWAILALPLLLTLAAPALNLVEFSQRDLCAIKAIKSTAAHRIVIWQFASEMTMRKPLTGWGMDSARAVPGGGDVVSIAKCYNPSRDKMEDYFGERLPLHPHNSAFQLWLELGAIGVLIAVLSLGHLMHRAYRNCAADSRDPALIAAVYSACFIVYSVSSGIWQSWLIFACIILFLLTNLAGGRGDSNDTQFHSQ